MSKMKVDEHRAGQYNVQRCKPSLIRNSPHHQSLIGTQHRFTHPPHGEFVGGSSPSTPHRGPTHSHVSHPPPAPTSLPNTLRSWPAQHNPSQIWIRWGKNRLIHTPRSRMRKVIKNSGCTIFWDIIAYPYLERNKMCQQQGWRWREGWEWQRGCDEEESKFTSKGVLIG